MYDTCCNVHTIETLIAVVLTKVIYLGTKGRISKKDKNDFYYQIFKRSYKIFMIYYRLHKMFGILYTTYTIYIYL